MHVVRLGYQGIELMQTGRLSLPITEPARSRIMEIRRGEWTQADVIAEVSRVEHELELAIEQSALRRDPDYDAVDTFIVDSYRELWGWC